MSSAYLTSILNAATAQVAALGLVVPTGGGPLAGQTVSVVQRKLAKREEGLDEPWIVVVCKSQRPERVRWIAFPSAASPTGTVQVTTWIDVVPLAPNDGDQQANLDFYASVRQQVRGAFQAPPLTGAPAVYDLDVEPDAWLPPGAIQESYDAQTVTVRVTTQEPGRPS